MQNTLNLIKAKLDAANVEDRNLDVAVLDGMMTITDQDLPEAPIYLIVSNDTVACWINVANDSDIIETERNMLMESMLKMHSIIDLSHFALSNGVWTLNGELTYEEDSQESIATEIDTLLENYVAAISLFSKFFK